MRRARLLFSAVSLAAAIFIVQPQQATFGAEPPALRYHLETGHKYVYTTELSFASPGERMMTGADHSFSVVSQSGDRITIQLSGLFAQPFRRPTASNSLESFVDSRQPGGPPVFIPQFVPSAARAAAAGPASAAPARQGDSRRQPTAVFSSSGELISGSADSRLPKLLGYQDQLMLEPLPLEPTSAWTRTADVSLVLDDHGTTCPAKEETNYRVAAVKGTTAHIVKNYSLHTAPDAKGVRAVVMTGCGNLDFDTRAGLFRSLAMTYVLEIARGDELYSIQAGLSAQLLDAQELAARDAKARRMIDSMRPPGGGNLAEARARAAQIMAEANQPKPFTAEVRASALHDLKSGNRFLVQAAGIRLSHAQRDDRADEISAALAEAMGQSLDPFKGELMDALEVWATANAESAIIEASKSNWPPVRDKAIEILGKRFKDDAAVDAIVAQFHANRGAAAAALKAIGSAAEKGALPLLKENDFWERGDAIGVLREIGRERSLHALKRERQRFPDSNLMEVHPFDDAIAAIGRRIADEDQADLAKKGAPRTRFWSDLSGTHEIEATLAGVKDHKALLQTTDHRQLAVFLEKLSDEDQEYVKRYLKAQAEAKPENPFQ